MSIHVNHICMHGISDHGGVQGPHRRTIGRNFGLRTADSCNLVLAASFAKDSEYFDHCR